MKNRSLLLTTLYLLFLAALTACADAFFEGGNTGTAGIVVKSFVYFLLFAAFFAITERLLTAAHVHNTEHSWSRLFSYSRKNILRLALILFSVYFVYLLVFYPGVTSGDTIYQIEDLVTGFAPMPYPSTYSNRTISALMIDSNPVATTMIFTMFYRIGLLLGDANRGLFLYCLLQSAVLSVLFATMVCYMDLLQVPRSIALVSTVFFASPIFASYAITMGKDVLFSLCFILYFHVYAWLILKPAARGGSGKQWLLLMLFSVIISLMNKKGVVLAVVSNLFLIFAVYGKRKLIAIPAALLPLLVISVLLQYVLFPAFNIVPGGNQEVLGIAFQQTSLSLLEHPERYSEDEKELFFSLLDLSPAELEEVYQPTITDPIKNRLPYDPDHQHILSYLRMWADHFADEAGTYLRATLSISGGYFSPHKMFNVYQSTPYSEALDAFSQPGFTEFIRFSLGSLIYWLQNIPIISIFSQDSFYTFWFPAFSFFALFRRAQLKKLVLLVPFATNLVFLFFAPVCITRYGLCQLFSFPMLMAIIASPLNLQIHGPSTDPS